MRTAPSFRRLPGIARGTDREAGAIAILMSLVMVAVVIPLLGYGTSLYVTSGTATDLQHGTDSGALAGTARIPLLNTTPDTTLAAQYIAAVEALPTDATTSLPFNSPVLDAFDQQVAGLVSTANTQLGIAGPGYVDPRTTAVEQCLAESRQTSTLAASFVRQPASCQAKYAPRAGVITTLAGCAVNASAAVSALAPVASITGTLTPTLNRLLANLQTLLPLLARPGIAVNASWTAHAPFEGISSPGGYQQRSVSYAAQQLKNVLVLPDTLGVNPNPTAQSLVSLINSTLSSTATTLPGTITSVTALLNAVVSAGSSVPVLGGTVSTLAGPAASAVTALGNVVSACTGQVVTQAQSQLDQLLDPPSDGPNTLAQIQQAIANHEPIDVVKIVSTTGIPALDFVQTCFTSTDLVTQLTDLVPILNSGKGTQPLQSCLAAQGVQRATLAPSAVTAVTL